ncbi:unnamed protein product [Lymnaea stagnalis]|uniref:Beta-sarcoglycan n=1 Tax=Lymnaea stagnalis TaxID=6523 RepID=A0AAV2I3J3_LYMST
MNTSVTRSTLATEGVSTGDVSTIGVRADPRSAMSVGSIGASTLSMRAKAARKRKVNATHNSNFRAGYVPVEEDALHRAGIRGRKRYFLYCVLAVLMFLAVINIVVIGWLLYILRMTLNGMESMELANMGGRNFLRVLDNAKIDIMSTNSVPIGSRFNSKLSIEAENGPLEMKLTSPKTSSSIVLESNEVTMVTDKFSVKTTNSTDWVTTSLTSLAAQELIQNLSAHNVTAKQIFGVKDFRDLYLESAQSLTISGSLGLEMQSQKTADLSSRNLIISSQSSTTIKTTQGLYLGKHLPKVNTSESTNSTLLTYKLCVCGSGLIFKVLVNNSELTCLNVRQDQLQELCGNG